MRERHLVAAAVVRDGGRVALVQNCWHIGKYWGLPGGRLEQGETAAEAAMREVLEETGLQVEPVALGFVLDYYNQHIQYHIINMVFACRLLGGELRVPTGDPHITDCAWVVEESVAAYVRWPQYRDPLLAYLRGEHRLYYVDKDAYRPEEWA